WDQKSEQFQLETTRVVRAWQNWNNFNYLLPLEDILFGHAQAGYTDTVDWRPTFWRSDDCVFPDGTGQNPEEVPLMTLKQNWQIHQLAKYLRDPEISRKSGWQIDNIVKAINDAQPENKQKGTSENARKVEDAVRETTMGRSYSDGVNVVETNHLFIQEATGKVSHYLYNAKNGDLLFIFEDQFDQIKHCLPSIFTLEVGNGTIYGAKGAGRVLYNTHVAIEQARNLIADALYLSGLLILKTTTANKKKIALTVTHPFCVLGDGYEVVEHNFKVDAEAFFALDRHMSSLAEVQIGVFMPGMFLTSKDAKDVTASAINYTAAVEAQIKEGVLARYRFQFNNLMAEIQRRMYSEENIKRGIELLNLRKKTGIKLVTTRVMNFIKRINAFLGVGQAFSTPPVPESKADDPGAQAAEAVANLLERGVSPTEIFVLANTPPDKFTEDPMANNPENISAVSAQYGNDPSVDKEELKKLNIGQKLGKKLADRLVIPGLDQTITQEAVAKQLMENLVLASGEDIPVSPRDAHRVHMGVIMETAGKLLETANENSITQNSLDVIGRFVAHFDQHLQGAFAGGEKPETLKTEQEFVETAKNLVMSLQGKLPETPQGGGAMLPQGAAPMGEILRSEAGQAPMITGQGVPLEAIGMAAVSAANKPLSREVALPTVNPL
ncbi:MAG: hypothetical protein PHV93_05080, partial [Candidatus Pacebacteria bacterium]|nr:hypothetical protein [Candidatus Paceibacterota bacterium]